MTIWIIPESEREGRAICQIWLQGGIHNETPTDKRNSSGRPSPPPPFKKEGVRGLTRFPESS